jgi:hypothetical protein
VQHAHRGRAATQSGQAVRARAGQREPGHQAPPRARGAGAAGAAGCRHWVTGTVTAGDQRGGRARTLANRGNLAYWAGKAAD